MYKLFPFAFAPHVYTVQDPAIANYMNSSHYIKFSPRKGEYVLYKNRVSSVMDGDLDKHTNRLLHRIHDSLSVTEFNKPEEALDYLNNLLLIG